MFRHALGARVPLYGNVSTLNWIAGKSPRAIADALGYETTRLDAGYQVAVLVQPLRIEDFELDGTTLRSGGKLGLPSNDTRAENARTRVRQLIVAEHGLDGYVQLKRSALVNARTSGPNRIVKVLPLTPHDPNPMRRATQYPMGGGGMQLDINRDHARNFLVALQVSADGSASTVNGLLFASLATTTRYDDRQRVAVYLSTVQ